MMSVTSLQGFIVKSKAFLMILNEVLCFRGRSWQSDGLSCKCNNFSNRCSNERENVLDP